MLAAWAHLLKVWVNNVTFQLACLTGKTLHLSEWSSVQMWDADMQATVCAKFGLPCIIYMGAKDMERQALNVFRMRLLGAEVRADAPMQRTMLQQSPDSFHLHALICLSSCYE